MLDLKRLCPALVLRFYTGVCWILTGEFLINWKPHDGKIIRVHRCLLNEDSPLEQFHIRPGITVCTPRITTTVGLHANLCSFSLHAKSVWCFELNGSKQTDETWDAVKIFQRSGPLTNFWQRCVVSAGSHSRDERATEMDYLALVKIYTTQIFQIRCLNNLDY